MSPSNIVITVACPMCGLLVRVPLDWIDARKHAADSYLTVNVGAARVHHKCPSASELQDST